MSNENDLHNLPGEPEPGIEDLDACFVPTPPLSVSGFRDLMMQALDSLEAHYPDDVHTEREWMEYLEDILGSMD